MESSRPTRQPLQAPQAVTRRAALAGAAAGGLASLLVALGRETGLAQATPATAAKPNLYSLGADGVDIAYSTSSVDGMPTFAFTSALEGIDARASGDEIGIEPLFAGGWPFGSMVSIYVDAAPDAWARSITLVLPEINLDAGREAPFTTFAILTRHLTTIGGPALVSGQLQEYELISLHGTAAMVVF